MTKNSENDNGDNRVKTTRVHSRGRETWESKRKKKTGRGIPGMNENHGNGIFGTRSSHGDHVSTFDLVIIFQKQIRHGGFQDERKYSWKRHLRHAGKSRRPRAHNRFGCIEEKRPHGHGGWLNTRPMPASKLDFDKRSFLTSRTSAFPGCCRPVRRTGTSLRPPPPRAPPPRS